MQWSVFLFEAHVDIHPGSRDINIPNALVELSVLKRSL